MQVLDYVKAHPYISGAVIVFGGLTFFLLSGMGGGSRAASGSSGPSDAQIAANAQIAAAQISAQASSSNNASQVALAQMQIGMQSEENQLNAELGRAALQQQLQLGQSQIEAERSIALSQIDADRQQTMLQIEAANKQAALQLAGQYINSYGVAQVAAISNPIANTSTSSKGGIFGIGKKSSSTTTYTPQTVTMPDIAGIIGSINGLTAQV